MSPQQLKNLADRLLNERRHAERVLAEETAAVLQAEQDAADCLTAQGIIQQIAQSIQQKAHGRVAAVVTKCVQAVFGTHMEFRIDVERKRGKTEARLLLLENAHELDPLDEACGGVVDVAAFGLRMAAIVLTRPTSRRLLICDEPFKNVNGEEYQARVAAVVTALAEDLDFQIVFVTDDDWLKVGKVIEL